MSVRRWAWVFAGYLPCVWAFGAALEDCHRLDDTGRDDARECYLTLLQRETADAIRADVYRRLGDISAANRAYRRAVEQDPKNPDLFAEWGTLFAEAHQAADAERLFNEALELDPANVPALTGLAELLLEQFAAQASDVIERVLVLEPGSPRAQILQARLLLEQGDGEGAQALLEGLLATDEVPARDQLEALALLAARDHIAGRATPGHPSDWALKALEINPRYGDAHAIPAHYYIMTRRYEQAVALLEQAVEVEPANYDAHARLGINLLRLNRMEEARSHLETAYEGDAFNAETVNTLRLLDTLAQFDTQSDEGLILRTHPEETAVLLPYVRQMIDRAQREMAPRYGFAFDEPVVLELYQHHDDFAVRTAGLPGIGILGAAFGDVVVMNGPSARSAEEWDWLSALWHEIAHVVTLNLTDNLVSRWFSEGVSVYEERRFGPTPHQSVPLEFLKAMHDDRLLGVADLDNGFMRPTYESQIEVSYVQSGLVCEFIADTWPEGLMRILAAYADGAETVEAIRQGLGLEPDEFDKAFFAHVEERYGQVSAHLDDFGKHVGEAARALDEERWAEAAKSAESAIALYPEYNGPGNPRFVRARALAALGEEAEALAELERYLDGGGRDPEALAFGAEQFKRAGRLDIAHRFQRHLTRLSPMHLDKHKALGELAMATGKYEDALTEFRAVLALDPHDKAAAHYQVASALHALGRDEEARIAVLQALEIAPRYASALSLLLEITQ